jgi:hypothetical protein
MTYIPTKHKGLILVITGIILMAISTYALIDTYFFLKTAVPIQGNVLSVNYHRGGWDLNVSYTPVGFQTVDAWISDSYKYNEGQTIFLLYDPQDHQRVRPLSITRKYPWMEITLIILSFALTGYGWIKLKRAKLNENL